MEITTRDNLGITIVDLVGRLETMTSGPARVEMNKIVKDGATKILINLEKTEYISSAGLRVLLTTSKLLKNIDGKMKICSANEQIAGVLKISGFNSLLSICESEKDALSAFLKEE
jgi:anti-anti-sigma factor